MKKKMLSMMLLGTLLARPAAAGPPTKFYNEKLAWGGVLTAIVGAALLVPYREPGSTDVTVYGHPQCVINNPNLAHYEIQNHACREGKPLTEAGLITMAAGGGMMLIGFHKVHVQPVVGKHVVGASASVSW
jgi:hypothetical protein